MRYTSLVGLGCVASCFTAIGAAVVDTSAAACRPVVADTLADMELADPQWSAQRAQIARQAAASACMKLHRRYADAASEAAEQSGTQQVEEEDLGTFLGMPRNKQSGGLHGKPFERRR